MWAGGLWQEVGVKGVATGQVCRAWRQEVEGVVQAGRLGSRWGGKERQERDQSRG